MHYLVRPNSLNSIYTEKNTEPRIEPCGTPWVILVDNIGPPFYTVNSTYWIGPIVTMMLI